MAEGGTSTLPSGSHPQLVLPSDEEDEVIDHLAGRSQEPQPGQGGQATRTLETLGQDVVNGLNLQKTQEHIADLEARLAPQHAQALKMLRQREDELKAQENIAATAASLTAKKKPKRRTHRMPDSDSDDQISGSSVSEDDTEPPEQILKPNKAAVPYGPHPFGYTPLNKHYRPPKQFHGKRQDDWNEFKNKLIKMFKSLQLEDYEAADQFCTYLESDAYKFWSSLPEETQASFPKVLTAFDKKYSNNHQQGSWQMQYENMIYLGPEKETLDELAIRIKDIVNKAYPDIIRKGVVYSKKEQRKINARRKFWDLMPDNIQKQLFVKFGSCDAPLRQQLEYARRIETSDMRTNKAEQRYMQICAMDQPTLPQQSLETISTAISSITQQNKELVQMVEKQANQQQQMQQKPPPRKQNWQPQQGWQAQSNQNWQQPTQQGWQTQPTQNWQPQQQQNWQAQSPQPWQQPVAQQQSAQNQKRTWTPQTQQQSTQQGQQNAQQQQLPRPRPTCNYCHKIGHVKKYCRSNPESQNYGQYPPRQQQQNQAPQQGYKPRPPPQDSRYGQNQNQQQTKPGFLPSRSGHPQDLREKKAPMNAMPIQRVQQQQPYKPTAAACQEGDEFEYLQHLDFDHEETLN